MRKRKTLKRNIIIGISILFVIAVITGIGIGLGSSRTENKDKVRASRGGQNSGQNTLPEDGTDQDGTNQESSGQAVTEGPNVEESSGAGVTEEPTVSAEPQTEETPAPPVPVTYPESEGNRKAYLTFDDGTSLQTDRILDVLARYNVKATFFVTAQSGEENAARYRRIVAEGHSIGLHSVSHNYRQIYENLDTYIADVEGIRQFVFNTTGVDSHLYRFPGGSSNTVSAVPMDDCIRYLNQNGYRYFDWNVDTSDTVNRNQSVDEVLSKVFGTVVDKYHNCVILMHDSAHQDITVAALPQIIEGLQARGLEILPITENTPVVQHKKFDSVQ